MAAQCIPPFPLIQFTKRTFQNEVKSAVNKPQQPRTFFIRSAVTKAREILPHDKVRGTKKNRLEEETLCPIILFTPVRQFQYSVPCTTLLVFLHARWFLRDFLCCRGNRNFIWLPDSKPLKRHHFTENKETITWKKENFQRCSKADDDYD